MITVGTVLHVWANPKPLSQSYSLRVAETFISRYRELCPEDEFIELDLYQQDIPLIDGEVLEGWNLVQGGRSKDQLSRDGREKLRAIDMLADGFRTADKYIFVTPLWNLGVPPLMKAYFDSVCIAGKTFKYTAQGPVGLLENKKAVHIQARGGGYSQEPARDLELGDRYVRTILAVMGVKDVESVVVEGMAQTPETEDQIFQEAISRAQAAAERFAYGPAIAGPDYYQHSVHPIH